MNCIEFTRQQATKINELCNADGLDDTTAETYEEIAQILLTQCAETMSLPSFGAKEHVSANCTFLKGQINMVSQLLSSAVMKVEFNPESIEWTLAYNAVDKAFQDLLTNVDEYPFPTV